MSQDHMTLWWLYQGGWVMIPLLLLSLLGVAITLERWNALRPKNYLNEIFLDKLRQLWQRGQFIELELNCEESPTVLAKIIKASLPHRKLPPETRTAILERNGQLQAQSLLKNLRPLGAIASLAPMLGLLGTVIGMIRAFNVVADGDPNLVSQSIAQALITTAAGLVIGILALFFYHFFRGRAERIALEMEYFITELFDTPVENTNS